MKVFLSHHKDRMRLTGKLLLSIKQKPIDQITLIALDMSNIPSGSLISCQKAFLLFWIWINDDFERSKFAFAFLFLICY